MAHQICQEGDVIIFFQEVFGKSVAEGMRIHGIWIYPIPDSQVLQLNGHSAGGDHLTVLIQENKSACNPLFSEPGKGFIAETAGKIKAAYLAAFCIQIQTAAFQMFDLNLKQFADSGAGGPEKPDDKVPVEILVLFQPPLQLFIISLGDDRIQIGTLLLFDRFQSEGELKTVQKTVDRINPCVDCIDAVVLQKVGAVGPQIGRSQLAVEGGVKPDRTQIGVYGIEAFSLLFQINCKIFQAFI